MICYLIVTSHKLNRGCWLIINWILRNKLQSNLNQNTIFIQEKEYDNVTYKMVSILCKRTLIRYRNSIYIFNGFKHWYTSSYSSKCSHADNIRAHTLLQGSQITMLTRSLKPALELEIEIFCIGSLSCNSYKSVGCIKLLYRTCSPKCSQVTFPERKWP